jgi:hypothetical protein
MMPDSPAQLRFTFPATARLDLTEEERAELVRALLAVIAGDRFPLSPRIRRLRQILEKLDPPTDRSGPLPPPRAPSDHSLAPRRKRRR